MQKKVYVKDLSLDEILDRLDKGEKVYCYGHNNKIYDQKVNGYLVAYFEDGSFTIGGNVTNYGNDYFLDEVEEPEADESCIGKLCEFWDKGDEQKTFGILQEIKMKSEDDVFPSYIDSFSQIWEHCRPLTKEEALKLIKE